MSVSFSTVEQFSARLADPLFSAVLFERLPDVVFFVKDTAGRYVVVNETLVRRCGRKRKSDVTGRTAHELFPGPLGASFLEQDRSVIASGREIVDRLELHHYADRTRGWCLTSKYPLRDRDGAIVGIAGVSRDLQRPDDRRVGYRGLQAAVDHMRGHFSEPMRVEELAAIAGMPVARFHRMVKRTFQLTPGQLLITTRVDEAARLLVGSDVPVVEVAFACGYSDHSAFSRQFRAVTGLSPTEFRRSGAVTSQQNPSPQNRSR